LVQHLLSSPLLSRNVKIRIYRTIILTVVAVYGSETWEEHRLRVFEKRMARRILD
jgi:hypothetical protein